MTRAVGMRRHLTAQGRAHKLLNIIKFIVTSSYSLSHHHIHCHIIIFIVTSSYSMTVQAVEHHSVQGGSQAAGKCRHHTAQGLRAREQVPQVRADGMCQHHIAQ